MRSYNMRSYNNWGQPRQTNHGLLVKIIAVLFLAGCAAIQPGPSQDWINNNLSEDPSWGDAQPDPSWGDAQPSPTTILEPEPEPELEEPSNGLGLRIAGSIFLADSTVGLLASPVYCDSLSYDENGYFDSEYYNSCMGIMVPIVVTEAIFGAVLLSSGIIKKAVVTRKLNKKFSISGTNVLVRF